MSSTATRPRSSGTATASLLRGRWTPHSNFIVDLLNFALWRENYRPEYREQRKANIKRLVHGPDFASAVHEVAHQHTAEGVHLPQVRLSLALTAAAEGDDEVRRIISAVYVDYLGSWKELYSAVMRVRHLRLREGLTLDDLAGALSAANDGMTLRAISDPRAGVANGDNNRSLMGSMALAVIYAFSNRARTQTASHWNRPSRRDSTDGCNKTAIAEDVAALVVASCDRPRVLEFADGP